MPAPQDWNELVPALHRLASPNAGERRVPAPPSHIVIHVTGTDDIEEVKRTFAKPQSTSAHYLVTKTGELFQFVPDDRRAFHAGIDTSTRRIYQQGRATWQRCLRFFNWYRRYPRDAVFVDGDLHPVRDRGEATFVMRRDGRLWSEFAYFDARWDGRELPINFDVHPDPNDYSIGIETLGVGGPLPDEATYPSAMYDGLARLVENLAVKYGIPRQKGRVVGHEDVNPVARFGWDPAPGFDWSRIF
jgi:N-acetyl-anhydromuramyl-L-alanine amidase AmpD